MASNPPESNTNKNTEWTSADDEISSTVELKNPKPYANIDFTEEVDAVVFHPQRTEDESTDLSPHPIDRQTFSYLTAVAPIRARVALGPDLLESRRPCPIQARPYEIIVLPQDAHDGAEGAFPKTDGTNSTNQSKP